MWVSSALWTKIVSRKRDLGLRRNTRMRELSALECSLGGFSPRGGVHVRVVRAVCISFFSFFLSFFFDGGVGGGGCYWER